MKKKLFVPLGIATSLSFSAIAALSGCGDSSLNASTKNVLDIDRGLTDPFVGMLGSLKADLFLKEDQDISGRNSLPDNSSSRFLQEGDMIDKTSDEAVLSSAYNSGDRVAMGDNPSVVVPNTNIWSDSPVRPGNIGVAVLSSPGIGYMDSENSVVIRRVAKDRNTANNSSVSENPGVVVSPPDNTDHIVRPTPDNKVEDVTPQVPKEKEIIIKPDFPDNVKVVFREIKDNSKYFSYSNAEGKRVCSVQIHGTVETYHDGELVSSEGDDKVGTVEIRNILTGDTIINPPGSSENYDEQVHAMFDFELYSERELGTYYSGYVEVYDSTHTSVYYDDDGNEVCKLTKYGTKEIYENGVLISSEGADKAGSIEIENLLTGEIKTYDTGDLSDYDEVVRRMFEEEVYWGGEVGDYSYAKPVENNETASYHSFESDENFYIEYDDTDEYDEENDYSDDYYVEYEESEEYEEEEDDYSYDYDEDIDNFDDYDDDVDDFDDEDVDDSDDYDEDVDDSDDYDEADSDLNWYYENEDSEDYCEVESDYTYYSEAEVDREQENESCEIILCPICGEIDCAYTIINYK